MAKKLSNEEFQHRISNEGEFLLNSEYSGKRGNVEIRSVKCGHCFSVRAELMLKDTRCYICNPVSSTNVLVTKKAINSKLARIKESGRFMLSGNVPQTSEEKTEFVHIRCGEVISMTVNSALNAKVGCKKCHYDNMRVDNRYTQEEFEDFVTSSTNGKYILVGEYKGTFERTIFKHLECGTEYSAQPNKFVFGNRCPKCNTGLSQGKSRGETIIAEVLDEWGIAYEEQKTFKDLKDIHSLSYDFFVPDYNLLIEYQGMQHYKKTLLTGTDEKFERQQAHDKQKKEYAHNNTYTLLEIPYTAYSKSFIVDYLKDFI